jgi:hypothetical protein
VKQLIVDLKNAWRAGKVEFPLGEPWFRVIGWGVEPATREGWAAFYVMITWIIGFSYFAVTGRDPLGLPIGGAPLVALAFVAFVACAAICVLKTDFSRNRE